MTRREIACPCGSTRIGLISHRLGLAFRCARCCLVRPISDAVAQ